MNILIVDLLTSGPDPELNAILGMGFLLLGNNLEEVRKGGCPISPFNGAIVEPSEQAVISSKYGISEETFLDILEHQIVEAKTIWAGKNAVTNKMFYYQALKRAKRLVPSNLVDNCLDTFTISFNRLYNKSVEETYNSGNIEDIMAPEEHRFMIGDTVCLSNVIITAEVLKQSFMGNWMSDIKQGPHVIKL